MLSFIKRTFGIIKATQLKDEILVEGVPTHFIASDISRIWKTSKISNFLFNKVTRNTFSISNFFALDLLYILETILNSKRTLGANKQTARKIIDALKESTWLGSLDKEYNDILDYSQVSQFWKTPLEFQKAFLDKYNKTIPKFNLKGYLLAGAAGSGKTYTSLLLSQMLHSDYVIIICPGNAVYDVWEKSITSEHAEFKVPRKSWIAMNNKPFNNEKFIIGHYESLNKIVQLAKSLSGKITIILDESHNLNNEESLRSKLFIELCDNTGSDNIIWCSGTPIKAMGAETITLFRTIDRNFTDSLKDKYKKLYGKSAKKALDILATRLDMVMHVVEKKELKLEDPIIEPLLVKADNSEQFTLDKIKDEMVSFISERFNYYTKNRSKYVEHYNKCIELYKKTISTNTEEQEFIRYQNLVKLFQNTTEYDKEDTAFCNRIENSKIMPVLPKEWKESFKDSKSVVKYVHLKVQGECLGRVLGKRRMECAKLISESLDYVQIIESTSKKTVIFTSYVEVVERAQEILKEIGLTPAVVYAKTNHMLSDIIRQFDKDPDVNPLVATFNSLSTAVPLIMADTMIMINSPFRDYVLQQAISRIHRLGATTQTYVYMASLDTGDKPNLSTRSIDILKWSQSQVSKIMGISSPYEINDENVAIESNSRNIIPGNEEFIITIEELEINQKII